MGQYQVVLDKQGYIVRYVKNGVIIDGVAVRDKVYISGAIDFLMRRISSRR